MKLIDIFEKVKAEQATKVFINPEDSKSLLPYPPTPVDISDIIDLSAIGRGGGVNWYEDASLERGTFRVE